MNLKENNVKAFLNSRNITAEHYTFHQSCHSVQEAAEAVNAMSEDFVKNICMIGPNNQLIVAIISGNDRASTKRVGKSLDIERPRLAEENEVFEKSGFPPGGVPSFGFQATFLVDDKLIDKGYIYTGGGSEKSLVKIQMTDILELNQAHISRVRK
ncbi:aminoacyl-tRNA deacylase [Staphylococcus nepalensis]|uniref:aminoacyl-tRNA deacylase n=1 Tax=Staphylococcus nepalensis TaxID=214473 RepID=UPI000DFB4950|nr:YbaK/EbsC family protein [Staphylococcus nepalensis]SUM71512.1 prolyl-tRNA synthetase [Staphylococcus nepalensis]SUM96848.1 prolyl-tRNA synthetase [Staphylococcus nepalensis]